MTTWIELDGTYYNKDAFNKVGPYDQDKTYILGTLRDGREVKIGPFASTSAASTALTAIISTDTVIGPYS